MKITTLLVSSFALLTTSVFANQTYQVTAEVYQAEQLIAQPSMTVAAGTKASMQLDNGFSYQVTVTPAKQDTIALDSVVRIGEASLTPQMTMKLGEQAIMEVGDTKYAVIVTPNL